MPTTIEGSPLPLPSGHPFWDDFDRLSWHTMQAGYELVCVTSIPSHQEAARLQNFRDLGFPIERVIATGKATPGTRNPKKAVIDTLRASWVVDDELRKLIDLDGPSLVSVDPGHPDIPNEPEWTRDHLAMEVGSLYEFAERLPGPFSLHL